MVRGVTVALGLGLVVLWIAALSAGATAWLTWLGGVAALLSFLAATMLPADAPLAISVLAPGALSAALFALWIIGLTTGASRWLAWWDFAFGCGFMLVAGTGVLQSLLNGMREPRTL